MQDSNPLPWGAQDRFQAHYIVRKHVSNPMDYTAKTILSTKGHFAAKTVTSVSWQGGSLAKVLDSDSTLNALIAQQSVKDATIFVDPTDSGVRIYGKWKNKHDFTITKDMYDIYNTIAGHIKAL